MTIDQEWRQSIRATIPAPIQAAMRRDGMPIAMAGVARAAVSSGVWEPHASGRPVYVLPVFDGGIALTQGNLHRPAWRGEAPFDLVAWSPRVPPVARLGEAWAFGWVDPERAMLWTTPAACIAADHGAVIIDWRRAGRHLVQCREIVAETIELGRQARDAVAAAHRRLVPPIPEISIRG